MKFTVIGQPIVEVRERVDKKLQFSLKIIFPSIEMSLDTTPDQIAYLMKNLEISMLAAVKMTNEKENDIEDISGSG